MATETSRSAQTAKPAGTLSAAEAIKAARKTKREDIGAKEVDEYGFTRVFDKNALVGVPFVIADWTEREEPYGPVAVVHIVTQDDRALFFLDGGAGIYQQLLTKRDKDKVTQWIDCPKGLRKSEYKFRGEPATTYYIDENVI